MTNWYRKPLNSTRLLNFQSNHSTQQKRNIVYNLVDRAIKLSHKKFHKENLKIVRNILNQNNYPEHFVNLCIKTRLRKIRFPQTIDKEPNKKFLFTLSFSHHKQFFNKTTKILKKYNSNTIPLINHQLTDVITLEKYKSVKEDLTGAV